MHRGSINGIPGGGLQSTPSNMSIGGIGNARSPNKESYLNRSASIDDADDDGNMRSARDTSEEDMDMEKGSDLRHSISPPAKKEGIPIRR